MNRAEHRQRHKYTKYKKCLGKVILKCMKPFLPVFPFDPPENIRKSLVLMYSCQFCEISQNTFFIEPFLATASGKSSCL